MNEQQTTETIHLQSLWPLVADDAVDRAMNTIIPEAERLVRDLFERYRKDHKLERSQFTNLVTVALETNSVGVVLDYVRYQIGRDTSGKGWRIPLGQTSFGAQLLEQLEGLRQRAGGLIDGAIRDFRDFRIEPSNRATEEMQVWMTLVRRYIGSLHRNFVYYEAKYKEGQP
jgi:hypothetical protein